MGKNTNISWTEHTWNPIRGCTIVSGGCTRCYAMRVAARFSGKGEPYEGLARMTPKGPRWTNKVMFVEKHLYDPLKWKESSRIFVNSMSDLFHEKVEADWIYRIFAVMLLASRHQFQVLTKRPADMREFMAQPMSILGVQQGVARICLDRKILNPWILATIPWPPPNVWLGVSCEDEETAQERIPILMKTRAQVRFLSCEPLLGPIDLRPYLFVGPGGAEYEGSPSGFIDWVIAGAESGIGARLMDEGWVRQIRNDCVAAKVAFFYKQKIENGAKVETPVLDGRRWVEYPGEVKGSLVS